MICLNLIFRIRSVDKYFYAWMSLRSFDYVCSSCRRLLPATETLTAKCTRHSFKLCASCLSKGKQCTTCERELESPSNRGSNEPSLQKISKDNDRISAKNNQLKETLQHLKMELAQKDITIRQIQLDKYKIKQKLEEDIKSLKSQHAKQLLQNREAFERDRLAQTEKAQASSKQAAESLAQENKNLKKQLDTQTISIRKASQLEMGVLKTNLENERQKMIIDLQNEKNQALVKVQNRQKQILTTSKKQIQTIKAKCEAQLSQTKQKLNKQIQQLKAINAAEKQAAQNKQQQLRQNCDEKIQNQTNNIKEMNEKQKAAIKVSFINEKRELEQQLENKDKKLNETTTQMNEQKQRLAQDHHNQLQQLRRTINAQQRKISQYQQQIQKHSVQNFRLSSHIQSYDKSLGFYQEEIDHFDSFIEKNNNHLVDQFKCLDDIYTQPSIEKVKLTQLLIKQYKDLVRLIKHEIMMKIIADKETIISNYVGSQMIKFVKTIEEIDIKDVYSVHSERGSRFKRVIQNINLFRSIQSKNINDTIEMYFTPKLLSKVKFILGNHHRAIAKNNGEKKQIEFVALVEDYYELKEFLSKQFPEHSVYCDSEYKSIDQNIIVGFKRFDEAYTHIKQSRAVEKMDDYILKAEELKQFVVVFHQVKKFRKYNLNLEAYLNIKMEEIKVTVLQNLSQYKKHLKARLDQMLQSRIYMDVFTHQKIYKRLRVFDEILTKEENSYYNFNFTETYNKLLHLLKIIKDEKIHLAAIIITDEKISVTDLQREYASISFDMSVKNIYLQRLKIVLLSRTSILSKINEHTLITKKLIDQFARYYVETLQLNSVKEFCIIPEVVDQFKLYDSKVSYFSEYLRMKFKQYYICSTQFKQLDQSRKNIQSVCQFELFLKKYFNDHYLNIKEAILSPRYSKIYAPEEEDLVFENLLRLNQASQKRLEQIINNPDEPLTDDCFDYYINMTTNVSKYEATQLQKKLQQSIEESISQLEAKEWLEGDLNSQYERKLLSKLNKLQNKDIAFYREFITLRKTKIIEQRQRIVNREKRVLKEDQFDTLCCFVRQCEKHQANNTKFYKLYINILEQYLNYSYENIEKNNDRKFKFVSDIYKLDLLNSTASIKDIFKSKEHGVFFCRPDLFTIKDNVQQIESFQGEIQSNIPHVIQTLANAFKLYSILKANQDKSLLEKEEIEKIHYEINTIKYQVTKNYINLCREIQDEDFFGPKCSRNTLFLTMIKIQMYLKLMKKLQEIHPQSEYYTIIEEYRKIIDRNNARIDKVYEQIKQFRFYKEDLLHFVDENEGLLGHLKKIETLVVTFKDIKYHLCKFEDYLKNNYLDQVRFKDIEYRQIISIIEMTWIKEYSIIKKEISGMFSNNHWEVSNKYKLILSEKELVKSQNLLYFNEFIKEQYDFKRTVIDELMLIEAKCERYIHQLQEENQFYSAQLKKMEENRRNYIKTEREKAKEKYDKLIAQVRNSFHQIESERIRQKKIESQINSLRNQMRSEDEERMINYETKNIENFRKRLSQKTKRWISKIFYITSIIKNVQSNFDVQVQQLCQRIQEKIYVEMGKLDKNIRKEFSNYELCFTNNQSALGVVNISEIKSKHKLEAKREIGNELRIDTQYNAEQNSINLDSVEMRSQKSQASRVNIQVTNRPAEAETNSIQQEEYAIKVQEPELPKVNTPSLLHNFSKKQISQHNTSELDTIIRRCPQLKDNELVTKKLKKSYLQYKKQLGRVQKQYLEHKSESRVLQLISSTKQQTEQLDPAIVLARIFAVYAIYDFIDSHQLENVSFDGTPHPLQVLSALLLVDAHNQHNAQLSNRLVEIKPGEGKSRVVAAVNCYLALKGYDVYCGTYSSYLSQRDQTQFSRLFVSFGVEQKITYKPFFAQCLSIIENKDYSFTEVASKLFLGDKIDGEEQSYLKQLTNLFKPGQKSNKILVIDQADIAFDKSYSGTAYVPSIKIDTPEVQNIIKYIWDNRTNDKLRNTIRDSEQYAKIIEKHPQISDFLQNQIIQLIGLVNNYTKCAYEIRDNDLCFFNQQQVDSATAAFVACFEFQNGHISNKSYAKYLQIILKLGQISYSQLPKCFDFIMGVTATINAFSDFKKQILKQQYRIASIYSLPSICEVQNRTIIGFSFHPKKQFINKILMRMKQMKKCQRPLLIVFENEDHLDLHASLLEQSEFASNIYRISESTPASFKNSLIEYAGSRGRITLSTSGFARGTDFMVYDSQINENGGMHVIQAYISSSQEDFIQIMGRTGRQGSKGSYQMIILAEQLSQKEIKCAEDSNLFASLKNNWKINNEKTDRQLVVSLRKAKLQHERMVEVISSLSTTTSQLNAAIMRWNHVETKSEFDVIKTIIAVDGTGTAAGSMAIAINALLNIIKEIIDRTDNIIKAKNRKKEYQHKVIVFRNYSSKYQKILEQSHFLKDANELQTFIASIKTQGGLGNQAHEVLFFEIGKICEKQRIDQIILIGDAAGNRYDQMIKHRKKFSGEAYWSTKIPILTKIQSYLEQIKSREIPIHSLYILKKKPESIETDKNLKFYFENLSLNSKGVCEELNVQDKQITMEKLMKFITKRVLAILGRDQVELYNQIYMKKQANQYRKE